jgi:ATPase family associated with various cellular activities (AAA)
MDDITEFMEQAMGLERDEDGGMARPPLIPNESKKSGSERRKEMEGAVSQYATAGGLFMPTAQTVKALPPDCYTLSMTMEGTPIYNPQKLVTDNLMRLPDSKSDEVVDEVEKFWGLKEKFKEFGFAHKRGFLLWGPPGSGKTSTTAIIVNDMIKKGGTVFLAEHPGVLGKALQQFRLIEPDRSLVVVLEDIDTIIAHYGENAVLSILDGEAQVENVVFIATTNYPEKLDGRIINRPSRFDKICKIGLPNPEARAMYLRSKVDNLHIDGVDIVKETEGLSIAHLKELIIGHHCQGNPVRDVITRLQKMKQKVASDNDGNVIGFR